MLRLRLQDQQLESSDSASVGVLNNFESLSTAMQSNSLVSSVLSGSCNLSYVCPLRARGQGWILPPFVHSFQYSWSISKPILQILELAVTSARSPHWLMSIGILEHMFILCPYESQHFAFLETYPEYKSHSTGEGESVKCGEERNKFLKRNDGQGM